MTSRSDVWVRSASLLGGTCTSAVPSGLVGSMHGWVDIGGRWPQASELTGTWTICGSKPCGEAPGYVTRPSG